jgi:hypothetical protein
MKSTFKGTQVQPVDEVNMKAPDLLNTMSASLNNGKFVYSGV